MNDDARRMKDPGEMEDHSWDKRAGRDEGYRGDEEFD